MKFQFRLRSLMLFVLWISLGLFINFQVRRTNVWYYHYRDIVSVTFVQGWPIEYTALHRSEYAIINVDLKTQTYDPQKPISVLTEGYGRIAFLCVLIDAAVWLLFYVCLWNLISLVKYFRRRDSDVEKYVRR